MSASQAPALTAVAFQLAAALEAYEQEVAALLAAPVDPELYRRVSSRMDAMRMYAAALPSASVPWVELLIRHFELLHATWDRQQQGPEPADVPELQRQHRAAVQRLARECTQLIAAG